MKNLIVSLFVLISLGAAVALADPAGNKAQLAKIQSSIELTKKKIRSTREVTFIPDLQFVMAELLLQKARLMYIVKKESNPKAKPDELDYAAEKRQVMEGIEQLRLIEEKYPNFSGLNKVLLTMGLELRKIGNQEKALQAFKRLAERNPEAAYASRAYLEIGHIFFEKKDYEFALDHYKKVTALPAGPSTAAANYKAGWCEINLEHFLSALTYFEKVFPESGPETLVSEDQAEGKKSDLREDALLASVWPYSELSEKEISENPRFLKPIEYYESQIQDKVILRRTLRRLAQRLDFKNRAREASEIANTAFLIQADLEESLEMMEVVFTMNRKAKRNDVSVETFNRIADNLWLLKERRREKDLKKYEPFFREMLTKSHSFALSIKRVEDLRALVNAYETYLKIYPDSKSAQGVLINQAEAAFVGQEYLRAAHFYTQVTERKIPKEKAKEFYDSAAQAYALALENIEQLSLMEKAQARTGYRNLTALYEKSFPGTSNLEAMKFNIGKNYYDEQSYTQATESFLKYLAAYPQAPHTTQAAILLMDSYYLQDDLKSLLSQGQRILGLNVLPSTKSKLQQVMQEAKLKQVQSVAGEFATKKYAEKFLEVAKNSGNSSLGESALFEAYNSLLAAGDGKFYEVGDQYLSRFRTGGHAKDILNQMIKTALITVELGRAANYMLLYVSHYPESSEAANYKSQAVSLMEMTGQADEAIETNLQNKNLLHAAELAAKFGRWEKMQQISANIPGAAGLYYQGLGFWRQGQKAEALALLQRCVSEKAETGSADLQAHAGVILAENQIEDLLALQKEAFSVPLLQKILELSKNTNQTLQGVLQQQSGRWSVASLAVTGRLNLELARVLSQAQPPASLPVEAFKKIVDPKIADYSQGAKAANERCLDLSKKEAILSDYTAMCRTEGKILVTEAAEMKISPLGKKPAVSMTAEIRVQLLKAPKSVEVLKTALKLNESEANFYGAYAVASRITEVDGASAQAWNLLGKAALKISSRGEALTAFQAALKIDPADSVATQGIAQILNPSGKRLPAAGSR